MCSGGAHFLKDDPACFDAPFFSISSKEAASMDPQQRLLLETAYHAMENAGIPVENIAGSQTGVFAGCMESDYHRQIARDPDEAPALTATGTSGAVLANRLSWYFDLQGPSIQLNTACSSSMVAMDLACQSLRNGQSSMALVTGSCLLLNPELSLYLSNLNMISPDGLCYSFDHRANGYSRGEGVVVVVLKTLSTAIRDGDQIRAVIRATGSNQDGRTPGITQPGAASQEKLIRQVYKSCGLGFESTRYVEAHGTGTQIGDSTEMKALGSVFRSARSPGAPLFVGSVKANIGHLEGGSGLAGILKCILMLEKGLIPPNPLFEKFNPKINAKRNNIQVPTSCVPWPSPGLRRVSVNSFGFGGSNGHVILDDAYHTLEALSLRDSLQVVHSPSFTRSTRYNMQNEVSLNESTKEYDVTGNEQLPEEAALIPISSDGALNGILNGTENTSSHSSISSSVLDTSTGTPRTSSTAPSESSSRPDKYQLLVYSARDGAALKRVIQQYAKYYDENVQGSATRLQELAYTLAARRTIMPWRSFTVGDAELSSDEIGLLKSDCVRSSSETQISFVFTGQGAQYAEMGLALTQYPVFLSAMSRANKAFQTLGADWSLFDKIETGEGINQPQFSQPLCTALQIALVDLLRSFNITPVAVVGHSSGEIAAAYTMGALSLESACTIAYHRGRLSSQLVASSEPGAMMSVNLQEGEVPEYVKKALPDAEIHVACVNSPSNVTLAGAESDIDQLKYRLNSDGIFCQKLKTGIPYHTPTMRQIASEYLSSLAFLDELAPDNSAVLMVSSVTGEKVVPSQLSTGQYWVDNLTSTVRFVDALQYLAQAAPKLDGIKAISDYIEIGPHGALRRPVNETLSEALNGEEFRYASVLSRFDQPLKTVMEVAGRLFTRGYRVSVTSVNKDSCEGTPSLLVNTPQYPFDHTRQYWYESRLNRDWRLRGSAPRSVLGVRSADWNSLEPRWRRMLSVEETAWIADHVVDGAIVFPAAGTIIMALEAVKQTVSSKQTISGYLIKEATFSNPIFVQEGKKSEVQTQLRPIQHAYEKTSLRFEVVVFALTDGNSAECFRGIIHATVEHGLTKVDGGFEARTAKRTLSRSYEQAQLSCTRHISKADFYKGLDKQNLTYGETFALAEEIFWDGQELCVARIDVSDPSKAYEGVVHPAVLDVCLQLCATAPSDGMSKMLATFIPHRLRDTWISATGWQHPQTESIRIRTQSRLNESSTAVVSSFTVLADDSSTLCHAKHVEMAAVASKESESEDQKKLLHSVDWKPHLSLLSKPRLSELCNVNNFSDDETAASEYNIRLENALHAHLQRNLVHFQEIVNPQTQPHLEHFVSWIERQLIKNPGQSEQELSNEALNEELENLRAAKPLWRIFIEIAQALESIIRGETDALELLFSASVAQDFYDEAFQRMCNHKFVSYIQLATHQTPDQRILEVGAGTGGWTSEVLSILRRTEASTGGAAFSEYVYTDISPGYFDGARERFAEYRDRMTFKTLDLERDITTQGFEPGTYDMILAGSVLHATRNLSATLQNLRRALKPGGQLVFLEPTAPDCFTIGFGFGILPGWWGCDEESRTWCPTITEAEWDTVLQENGFSGNDLVIRDYHDERAHYFSIVVSSADRPPQSVVTSARTLIITNGQDENQKRLASGLQDRVFNSPDGHSVVLALSEATDAKIAPIDTVVLLADLGKPLLADPSDETFQQLQNLMQQSKQLLWITSSSISQESYPYAALKDGFLRVMRSENDGKRLISLSLENDTLECIENIAQVFDTAFKTDAPDCEYIVRDGQIMIGRLVQEVNLDRDLNASIVPQATYEPWLPGPPLKFDVGTRGSLDTLRFIEDPDQYVELGPADVEIEVKSWALGFRDLFSALGRLDEKDFGSDLAGVVSRVGPQCTALRPGDRVCTTQFGCMRTYVRAPESDIIKLPESLSLEEACGVINPGMTALYSLVDVARLQKGEKILIHSASGATGQAAVQVAQMVGAEVFATVGYDHKKQLLMDEYGIPESNIFYSRDLSFAQGIMRATGGYGVDVVLNSLVGEGLRSSWECVAPYGRFIEIGKADIHANAPLPMASFARNVTFAAVDLRDICLRKLELARRLFQTTIDLTERGTLHCPGPLNVFSVSAIEEAFRYFQSGKQTGRIVIRTEHSAKVQKYLKRQKACNFDETAAYLIAGGLGGIGRATLRWMASKGARYLIVPSRSGAASKEAKELVKELNEQGVEVVTPKCDISEENSLRRLLEEHGSQERPIRGCINASMVLQDSVFENMTSIQWQTTIRSKVQTSWNLHEQLPKDLDFFILLSSIAGVGGNPGQSNYAAGCTFQDSLARYRTYHGQRGLSLDLGVMRTIGVVAENQVKNTFEKYLGGPRIEEEEYLALLDIVCGPDYYSPGPAVKSQITIGITTPAELIQGDDKPLEHLYRSFFAYFNQTGSSSSNTGATTMASPGALFRQAETAEEMAKVVVESLVRKLARALSIQPEDVDRDKPLHLYGVDSLVAVELRNWIAKEFSADVPVFELMSGKTILAIGEFVTKMSHAKKAG
ncbi:polyketide synthase PksD [Xylaria grammica]|nr:polyketide synthase PksD [Xylaria grammica]